MSDFANDMSSMTFGSYSEDEAQGDGLIRIQWRQGDPKTETPGFFFLAGENVPEGFQPGKPWTAHTEYFEGTRARVAGWKAEALPVAIVCARAQPYIRGERKTWLDKWPKDTPNVAMHVDVLLVADGLQELGPVCWSTNGTKTSFAIIGRARGKEPGGILDQLKTLILIPAGKLAGRDLSKQPWIFWATIATNRDAKGKIVYTETPGKLVTLPVLQLPATIDKAYLNSVYAGREMAEYGETVRRDYDAWKQAKFTNDEPQPAKAGKNVPQPIEDGELVDTF